MAIALDSTTATKTGTASAVTTNSHTCSGTDGILFVGITIRNTRTITVAPTYNGVTMTLAKTTAGATNLTHFLYYLVAPSTGTGYTVNFTQSASDTYAVATISYTGVNQYTPIDASTSYTGTATTSFSPAVTTVADNSWAVFWGNGTSGAAITAGALTTVVNQPEVAFAGAFLIRSTAEKTPAGTFTLNVTSSTQTYSGNIVSFKPSAPLTFKQATVNAASVPATQTNFPSYVDLSRLGITTLAEAQSVRVYADSGKTTEWAREIVSATEMHVKVPSMTSTTSIYVDWDGVRADYAVTDTYGRNAVWSDYRAVYHLESLTADSTAQGYTLTNNGSVATTTGKVGGGGDTGATNTTEVLNFSDGTNNFLTLTSAHTVSYWINFTTLPVGADHDSQLMMFTWSSPNFRRYGHRYQGTSGFGYELVTDGLVWSGDTVSAGTWNHILCSYDATTLKMYLNGTEIDSRAHSFPTQFGGDNNLKRISLFGPNTTGEFCGKMDTVRVKQSATSTTWITTEYNNQSDEATFWGTWSDVGGSTDYPMIASVGAFILTGVATTLTYGRKLTASVGSFILTAPEITILYGERIAVATGAFILSASDAVMNIGRTMPTTVGEFIVTSVDTTFTKALKISAQVGTFLLNGVTVILRTPTVWIKRIKNSDTWNKVVRNSTIWTDKNKS